MSSLPAPGFAAVVDQWSPQPVALVASIAALAWYLWALRRLSTAWPRARTATFVVGVLLFAWTANGFLEAYSHALYWAWTAQYLALLLVLPVIVMSGQPIELARLVHGERAQRFVTSRVGRFFANPLVGPALIPILSAALFFGPLAGWAIGHTALGWVLEVVVAIIGALIVLPLVGVGEVSGSLAVALALLIGVFELLLDAVPGIALRLNTHIVTGFFDHRHVYGWSPRPIHDQQFAGGILWVVAELIDLPFLLLVYARWVRADAHDAAVIDTVLDAERIARGQPDSAVATDAPWWLNDPSMQQRFRK